MANVNPLIYRNGRIAVLNTATETIDPDALPAGLGGGSAGIHARVASIADITISSPGAAIDGVTLTTGDLVLLKDQTVASQNGIYVFNGAASPATRYTGLDADAEAITGMLVTVAEGNINATSLWMLATYQPITIGSTDLTFMLISVGGKTTISVDVTVDFGTIPTRAKQFAIAFSGLVPGQRVDVSASGYTPAGVDFDEAEFEAITWVGKVVNADELLLIGNSTSPVNGQRIVQVVAKVLNSVLVETSGTLVPDFILQGAGIQ